MNWTRIDTDNEGEVGFEQVSDSKERERFSLIDFVTFRIHSLSPFTFLFQFLYFLFKSSDLLNRQVTQGIKNRVRASVTFNQNLKMEFEKMLAEG